jgi:hypothetical protein
VLLAIGFSTDFLLNTDSVHLLQTNGKSKMTQIARFSRSWSAFCLLSCLFLGCGGGDDVREIGPTGEVEGTVNLDGEPLTGGSVAFYQESTGNGGGGELGPDGKFKFDVPTPVGTYLVAFQPPAPPQPNDEDSGKLARVESNIPEGYQAGDTSLVTAEVKEGPNTFTFKLTKTGPTAGTNTAP